jgi:hypothetical protein
MTESMDNRQRAMAILHYQPSDRLPIVHFGFWGETLWKWHEEGHLTSEEATTWGDGNTIDVIVSQKLGFDFNWYTVFSPTSRLTPGFEYKVIEEFPDGSRHVLNNEGVIVLQHPDANSIPAEVEHMLKDRASWEELYKFRYQWSPDRVNSAYVRAGDKMLRFDQGGKEFLQKGVWDVPMGLYCGSLYGDVRNVLGVVGSSYMMAEDDDLFTEIIDAVGEICYQNTKYSLESGAKFDFAHFWEDICFKNGPLISPRVFSQKVGPHYKRITDLVHSYGIDIISLDCDGMIDALIPTWLSNGVNTMFPIEVGTWNASIAPWREKYGREIRGVGGMNKTVFAFDKATVDAEIERLKPLVALGGFIPCPDHRIAPDAKWDLVRYYCDKMHKVFA